MLVVLRHCYYHDYHWLSIMLLIISVIRWNELILYDHDYYLMSIILILNHIMWYIVILIAYDCWCVVLPQLDSASPEAAYCADQAQLADDGGTEPQFPMDPQSKGISVGIHQNSTERIRKSFEHLVTLSYSLSLSLMCVYGITYIYIYIIYIYTYTTGV